MSQSGDIGVEFKNSSGDKYCLFLENVFSENEYKDIIADRKTLDVVPKVGSVLLFNHELLYTGREVIKGRKYRM